MNKHSDLRKNKIRLYCFYVFCFIIFLLKGFKSNAQTLPLGMLESVEDQHRREQLISKDTSGVSLMIRPVNVRMCIKKNQIIFLPIIWINELNSRQPYGMNDGSMIPAKGYQAQISAGFFAKAGPLSLQFRPEFVYAGNKDYVELQEMDNGKGFGDSFADYYNSIDLPTRFGIGSYKKANWGQSSIRLTVDPISIGLSTENLWWGPGSRNSLLMSNNAPGFKHLTLNTSKPVHTLIGSFEIQLIAGRLENSGVEKIKGDQFKEKPDDWRYISAIAFTYQPKWIPNLFLGFDRSFVVYHKDMGNKFSDYLPVFSSPVKQSFDGVGGTVNVEDQRNRDQYFSVFTRWVLPESHSEVYFEYGRNDFSENLRDAIVEPEHSRAYIVGYKKLIPLKSKDTYLQFATEITHLEGSNTGMIRDQPIWYRHRLVPAGYTNVGQVLGAGIGPEANMKSFDLSWVHGLKRIGLRFERLVNNIDLSTYANKWIDYSFAGKFDWDWRNFVFNTQLIYIRSKNYQFGNNAANNFHLQLGILYTI